MTKCWQRLVIIFNTLWVLVVASESYYSIIAPGVMKSNRKYTVVASLHEATEPALMRIRIDGPATYAASQDVFLRPYETKRIQFENFHLEKGIYNLTAEGITGIHFHKQEKILVQSIAGPKIYLQTDRAMYRPGGMVNFRVLMLDEHTKPLKIREPIRIEIMDGNGNRIKQFKDIALTKGVFTSSFRISKYPAMGRWEIKVILTGKYDYTESKYINIQKYILPKFSVNIKTDSDFVPKDRTLRATVYGKYTFDRYVEGNITATVVDVDSRIELQQKRLPIEGMVDLEFTFDNPQDLEKLYSITLRVELIEKYTGITHSDSQFIRIRNERYCITVDANSIAFIGNDPHRIKAKVTNWVRQPIVNQPTTPFTMQHGSKEYQQFLDDNGEAVFEFEYEENADHIFRFSDAQYKFFNIFRSDKSTLGYNATAIYCKMHLRGARPRLGSIFEIEVSSTANIPYLVLIVVAHGGIVRMEHIKVPQNQNTYRLKITPSVEMIPHSIAYVHYIRNGQLYYDEMKLEFPMEFENQISVTAPSEVKPGQEITLKLKAQRKSYVSILAVDLSVYLLDPSFDLNRNSILNDLILDQTYLPFDAVVYPGALSGVLTLTNALHPNVPAFQHKVQMFEHASNLDFRKSFPETWIFRNYEITDEETQITVNIPETITTWRITAFSVHEVTGLGMVDGPTDIVAIKPFFINLNLPYTVKRGELIPIPITLFNYHNQSVDCEIVMHNENMEFYFVESTFTSNEQGSEDQKRVQHMQVQANGAGHVKFFITPKQVGELYLRISAKNPLSSDAVLQKLKVEPEGLPKRNSKSMYVSAPLGEIYSLSMLADIPLDIISDSEHVVLNVGGDTLVPALENLNGLVHLPTGSGEQNMINFAPNILVLDFLKFSKRYGKDKKLINKAKNFIEIGYQQQLSYRHNNGGFSVFGPKEDTEPSTWLTAYVIRYFIKAEKYLSIEDDIIKSGLDYLAGKQKHMGDFAISGYVIQPAHHNRFGFTAFVLMTFLEIEKYSTNYQATIQKSLTFLKDNLNEVNDAYALALMAAALQMANDTSAQLVLHKLEKNQSAEPGLKWWSDNDVNREKDVEITAYVLMALLDTENDAKDDLRILRWLLTQRNDLGGFRSTHDTVIGLQALVKFSQKYNDLRNHHLKIQYTAKDNESQVLQRDELEVDSNNALVLQMEELPRSTRSLDFEISGTGYTLLQLSYRYHTLAELNFRYYDIQPEATLQNPKEMILTICFRHHHSGLSTTNMLIMEVNLPSGFASRVEEGSYLLENEIIQRVEKKNADSTLVIYFKTLMANTRYCFNILADQMNGVMLRKPAAIVVYDYYNLSRYDTVFYTVQDLPKFIEPPKNIPLQLAELPYLEPAILIDENALRQQINPLEPIKLLVPNELEQKK